MTDRIRIEAYRKAKIPVKEIAALLNVHISTIYRELKRGVYEHRNTDWTTEMRYSPDIAEDKYRKNLAAKGPDLKIADDFALADYIERRIVDDKLTPIAVIGEIKKKQLQFKTQICVNTLYSYIYKGVFLRLSLQHLPIRHKIIKRKRKLAVARPPRGQSIEKRPSEINARTSFGHWEMDCVAGKTKKSLLVLTERYTRKEFIFPISTMNTDNVVRSLNVLEKRFGKRFPQVFKSITVDNGTEFSDCVRMEKSIYGNKKRTQLYYCHPYSSYERGTNERMNREIRRQFPKGTDFSTVSDDQITALELWLNDYPRKILDFSTPNELFLHCISAR